MNSRIQFGEMNVILNSMDTFFTTEVEYLFNARDAFESQQLVNNNCFS